MPCMAEAEGLFIVARCVVHHRHRAMRLGQSLDVADFLPNREAPFKLMHRLVNVTETRVRERDVVIRVTQPEL